MEKGKIIVLNGVSSAGKSTLARTLQNRLSEPYYILANDTFCDMSPDKFIESDAHETYSRALIGMYHTIKTFSEIGINVIVDDVFLKENNPPNRLEECLKLIHEYSVLFVHVTCPLEEQRRREKERRDGRSIGQGESQLAILDPQDTYDITVDTYNNSLDECADKIIGVLGYPDKFTAFKILWSQRIV